MFETTANSLDNHWAPFTPNKDFKASPRFLERGEGVYYYNDKGEKLIDGSSALFNVPLGHGRMEIAEAIGEQAKKMAYAPSFNVGHELSFELASRLSRILPSGMNRVFFNGSGSEAIETAIKIVMAYNRARGEGHRSRFVSRERAYHGVNLTGVSLSGMIKNRQMFNMGLPYVSLMRHTHNPATPFVKGQPTEGADLADDLQRACDNYGGDNIAACFVEPIAGSTGTLVPPVDYLDRLREICDKHGIVLVFDEVITGFGRTGKGFAAEKYGVTPDIMTMAKAISNGAIPMGATAVKQEIYDTVVDAPADDRMVEFFHGYTYSAHPVACAAALATLKIYEDEGIFERAGKMESYFQEQLFSLEGKNGVVGIRGDGMMGGVDVAPGEAPGLRGIELTKNLWEAGMHIKFTGDCGIIAPALVATESQIDEMIEKLGKAIDATFA